MSDQTPQSGDAPDMVADLIRAAGRREPPPADIYERVRADALQAFAEKTGRRRARRNRLLAAAATVAVGLAAVLALVVGPVDTPAGIATLVRVSGPVETMIPETRAAWQTVGGTRVSLPQGSRLRTGDSALAALTLADGISVRLDRGSEISLVSPLHLALHTGRIYVDAGDDPASQIAVTTPAGVARDIGTRFEVQYLEQTLRLRIRDGRVELSRDAGPLAADAGEQIRVDAGGAVSRSQIAPDAPAWRWIEQVALAPDIDGRPVRVLLDWVARETGKTLRFSDASVESDADQTLLHGDVSLLAPLQALSVMLATTDFGYVVGDNGEIEIWSKARQ